MGQLLVLVGLTTTAACRNDSVDVFIDARGIGAGGAGFAVSAFADDGGGCEGQRFLATPGLTLLTAVTVSPDEDAARLEIPRLGDKLVIVNAVIDATVVGRGCAAVGIVDGVTGVAITIAPTSTIAPRQTGTIVVRDVDSVVDAIVVDASGAPAPGVTVAARAEAADGRVLTAAFVDSDRDGVIRFAPRLSQLGPVRFRLTPERPVTDDVTAQIDGFAAPTVEVLFGGAELNEVTPFVIDGDVAVISVATTADGDVLQLRRRTGDGADGDSPRTLVAPSLAVRALAAFEDRADSRNPAFVLAVVRPDATTPAEVVAIDPRADSGVDSVIAAHPLGLDPVSVRAVAVGDCRRGPHSSPALMVANDGAAFVDIAFGLVVVVPIPPDVRAALPTPLVSGCVADDSGALHRVVFGSVTEPPVDLGPGLARIGDAPTTVVRALPVLDRIIQVAVRDDGTALFSRVDAGQVLVVPHRLNANAFVALDAAIAPTQLLPSAPLFVAQGLFFGDGDGGATGANDTLAILDLGTDVDPTASALFGVAGDLGTGVDGICEPAGVCSKSLAVDVDGDGRLELVTFGRAAGGGVVVRLARFAAVP